jgi:hypothetical protein
MKREPYCWGQNCPIRDSCCRYNPKINIKKEDHFVFTPYNHDKKKCAFFIGNLNVAVDQLLKSVIDNGKENTGDI